MKLSEIMFNPVQADEWNGLSQKEDFYDFLDQINHIDEDQDNAETIEDEISVMTTQND